MPRRSRGETFECFLLDSSAHFAHNRGLKELIFDGGSEVRRLMVPAHERLDAAVGEIIQRAQDAGELRKDLVPEDFPALQVKLGTAAQRTRERDPGLWRRCAVPMLGGFRVRHVEPIPLGPDA